MVLAMDQKVKYDISTHPKEVSDYVLTEMDDMFCRKQLKTVVEIPINDWFSVGLTLLDYLIEINGCQLSCRPNRLK